MLDTPTEHVDPAAQRVIDKCGGAQALADAIGYHVTAVYQWPKPRSKRGTGGLIPSRARRRILEGIRDGKLPLTPEDLMEGRAA